MRDIVLHDPLWLAALAAVALALWLRGRRRLGVLLVPFAADWHRPSLLGASRRAEALVAGGLGLLALALARPQRTEVVRDRNVKGYDIMVVLDLSGSMTWEDHPEPGTGPSRSDTIRPIVRGFIEGRPNDRIGMVVFGRRAYTLSPPTFDHDWLEDQVQRMNIGIIDPDGTVIGDGLGMAINRLGEEEAPAGPGNSGKFIILLTDGGESMVDSPTGPKPLSLLPPLEAARLAAARGIRVYCIGVGREGYVWAPYFDNGKIVTYSRRVSDLDPDLLKEIARATRGAYFRAEDGATLSEAFAAIDRSQKTDLHAKKRGVAAELFGWFAAPGLALVLAGLLADRPVRERRPSPA